MTRWHVPLPRNAQLWLPGLVRQRWKSARRSQSKPVDILLCVADHFEPGHGNPGLDTERRRVDAWVKQLPHVAAEFADSDGRPPQHTFFFPADQYKPEHLDRLSDLCGRGFGEVEVHLHHDRDTSDNLRRTLTDFTRTLHFDHGLLSTDGSGRLRYAFIHGNWALDNARPDGRWCGVNNELTILRETGCYGDFTQPAAPDPSQTITVNSIYYAVDDPDRPRSHDRGTVSAVGAIPPEESLLMIQGPLGLDWRRRWRGILPGLENAAIDGSNPPRIERFRRWVDIGIGVAGRPEWVFVKLHTHGAPERNAAVLLGQAFRDFHAAVTREFNDGARWRLHYVTAREMANIIRAAEDGRKGNAGLYRDYGLRSQLFSARAAGDIPAR